MTALPTSLSAGLFRTDGAPTSRRTASTGYWAGISLVLAGLIAAFATDIPSEHDDSFMAY